MSLRTNMLGDARANGVEPERTVRLHYARARQLPGAPRARAHHVALPAPSSLEHALDRATEEYHKALRRRAGAHDGALVRREVPGVLLSGRGLTWRGMSVSAEFERYAERVARGERLAPYRGVVLSEPCPAFPWRLDARDTAGWREARPRGFGRAAMARGLALAALLFGLAFVGLSVPEHEVPPFPAAARAVPSASAVVRVPAAPAVAEPSASDVAVVAARPTDALVSDPLPRGLASPPPRLRAPAIRKPSLRAGNASVASNATTAFANGDLAARVGAPTAVDRSAARSAPPPAPEAPLVSGATPGRNAHLLLVEQPPF